MIKFKRDWGKPLRDLFRSPPRTPMNALTNKTSPLPSASKHSIQHKLRKFSRCSNIVWSSTYGHDGRCIVAQFLWKLHWYRGWAGSHRSRRWYVRLQEVLPPILKDFLTANINDLEDPLQSNSDRAPLTGNIQPSSSRSPLSQSYLNSSIQGEDRRAPTNTIDESVWETLSRDVLAVWEKMRQVLWPKYLLGGMLQRGGGIGGAERGEGESLAGGPRGVPGRWPDSDVVLQGGMSEGLRDWDLWWAPNFDECFEPS